MLRRSFSLLLITLLSYSSQAQSDSLTVSVKIDTNLTELARYLGGITCLTPAYRKLQQASDYSAHRTFTQDTWQEFTDSTLVPVLNWAIEKKVTETTDTGTCFYPFSGPDFLFAHTFYPYAKQYVLMGLERCGSYQDVQKFTAEQRKQYLASVKQALRYMVRSGYFVTSHMGQDLTKSHLNGTLHMILYFAARTGHHIVKMEYGHINSKGSFTSTGKKASGQYYKGMHLTLSDTASGKIKDLYYYSCDIADYKIKNKDHLTAYVKQMGHVGTYLKSASYIPAHKNFSIIRNAIVNNSYKIIQDDTGIPYNMILSDTSRFDYQMWGTYTKTIKDLEWGFQSDLKKAVQVSEENKNLPYRISYNGNYGEGLIMYARKKKR